MKVGFSLKGGEGSNTKSKLFWMNFGKSLTNQIHTFIFFLKDELPNCLLCSCLNHRFWLADVVICLTISALSVAAWVRWRWCSLCSVAGAHVLLLALLRLHTFVSCTLVQFGAGGRFPLVDLEDCRLC